MLSNYNPIVRTFCQLRAALVESGKIERRVVRPDTPIEDLLPEADRRNIWQGLQRRGLKLPGLELSEKDFRRNAWHVLRVTTSTALSLQRLSALIIAAPIALIAYCSSRRCATQFPLGLNTVGELVVYLTNFTQTPWQWLPLHRQ